MTSSAKRCLYEVLGVDRECSADEIRSAYRKLALQLHPDKLVQRGVPEAEATAAFQELINAYEVLSDPRERAWYDSNRNQILFSSSSATSGSSSQEPDLFPFFSSSVFSGYSDSGHGFYKVYGDVFEKIYASERGFAKKFGFPEPREAPVLGNSESPYLQVTAFYNYWLGFSTVLDFFWVDEVAIMPNRKSRRLLEDHNKKLRKTERKKYNDIVRQLSEFVKKRDKRVRDMQIKKNEEMKMKRELEKEKLRDFERQKREKARNYEEPDWSKVEEVEADEIEDVFQEKRQEFYCVICSKKFRSDKQWKNHEQSRRHKEKARELREAFGEKGYDCEVTERSKWDAQGEKEDGGDFTGHLPANYMLDKLKEQFEHSAGIKEGRNDIEVELCAANESGELDNSGIMEACTDLGLDDDESITLETMVSVLGNMNNVGNQQNASARELQVQENEDEPGFMTYATMHSRGNRRGRRRSDEGLEKQIGTREVAMVPGDKEDEEIIGAAEESKCGQFFAECEANNTADDLTKVGRNHEVKTAKNTKKKGNMSKLADPSKANKKVGANCSDNMCEKCEEGFESRNKLHKHLAETGHASLKHRQISYS